jgi:hypothetical protein
VAPAIQFGQFGQAEQPAGAVAEQAWRQVEQQFVDQPLAQQ